MGFSDSKSVRPKSSPYASKSINMNVSSSDLIKPRTNSNSNLHNVKRFNPFSGFNLGVFKRNNPKKGVTGLNNTNEKKKAFRSKLKKAFSIFSGIAFFLFLIMVIVIGIYLKQIEEKLPKPGELLDRSNTETTIIYDRNGNELYKIFPSNGTNRIYIKLSDLNDYTVKALLASEDWQFYQHKGIDWLGNIRCVVLSLQSYVTGSGNTCGASTISQQLVRNTLMYDAFGDEAYERSTLWLTIQRKVREMLLTIEVEQSMSKDQMLEMYINEVGVGGANNGFEAGARSLFDKSAKDLTLAESALLVGLLPSPERYNPIYGSNPEMAEVRKNYVLDNMTKHKDALGIDAALIEEARNQEIVYNPAKLDITAPHFVFYVRNQLVEKYGLDRVERGGLKVTTTLDMDIQNIAQEELVNGVNETGHPYNVYNGAVVGIDPKSGQIIAMVGSVDYNNNSDSRVDGNVNNALSLRQMGSSMKPYAYLTAYEQGYGPWLNTPDIKEFNFNYNAVNWDGQYSGFMTAREALVKSRNIPALYIMQMVGISSFIQTTERLGITSLTGREDGGLPLVLGGAEVTLLEHTSAFTVFSNEGIKRNVVAILKVTDKDGNILEEYVEDPGTRVFDEKDIYLLNYTLCDLGGYGDQLMNFEYLNNSWDANSRFACGKGGTNLKYVAPTDIVQMLYHKNFTLGVWLGNNDSTEFVEGAYSSTIPLPISIRIMKRISSKYPSELFGRPAGIASTTVCKSTGGTPGEAGCDQYGQESTVYAIGKGPAQDTREKITVCKDNFVAPTNLETAKKFNLTRDVYRLKDYKLPNSNQQSYFEDFLHGNPGLGLLIKEPDTGECQLPLGPGDTPIIEITAPVANTSFEKGANVPVTILYRVKENVNNVKYYLDGSLIPGGTINVAPYNFNFSIPNSITSGEHELLARITDTEGKVSETSITIIVTNPVPASISITSPSSGSTISTNFTVSALVTGASPATVNIEVVPASGIGGFTTSATPGSGGGWSATIDPIARGMIAGDYNIRAVAGSLVSGSVTVTYTP